jgi:hypothetical protein
LIELAEESVLVVPDKDVSTGFDLPMIVGLVIDVGA